MVWLVTGICGLVANEGEFKNICVTIHKVLSWIYIGCFCIGFIGGLLGL